MVDERAFYWQRARAALFGPSGRRQLLSLEGRCCVSEEHRWALLDSGSAFPFMGKCKRYRGDSAFPERGRTWSHSVTTASGRFPREGGARVAPLGLHSRRRRAFGLAAAPSLQREVALGAAGPLRPGGSAFSAKGSGAWRRWVFEA